ncbi:MAG: polymer-forming cytoskeletal protein [Kiloniellales bacterium]|nr:polymer-forming cytoskeletal protein [Kiloniellales bacterium]
MTGEVLSEGQIEIYGTVQGKVNSKRLTVEEGALIKGSIVAEEVRIRGAIQGPITANSVVMDSTAWVEGSIFHHVLSAHPESVHRGRKPWRLRPLEECSEL